MPFNRVIYLAIGLLILGALAIAFGRPIKAALRLALRCALGTAAIFTANFLLSPLGVMVGINLYTALATGLLGLPGFIMLYALTYILKG